MNKKFNIGGNCAPKMSQVWDKIKRIVKTMENRWTKKETLRPADEQKTETHLLEQLGSLGLLLLLLPSLALPQLRSCDRRDKVRNQGAIHPTVSLKKKKKKAFYLFIYFSILVLYRTALFRLYSFDCVLAARQVFSPVVIYPQPHNWCWHCYFDTFEIYFPACEKWTGMWSLV